MPRANRFIQPGLIYHLTHRCHDRAFLFRFARDRTEYRERLRQTSKEFEISLLNYCLTSNHTHIIAIESWSGGISRMMQKLEGVFAGYYNRRKGRSGSFWEDRYHCTMIEDGRHLRNCMVYVDMNMVRAAVVAHPREWPWCGYLELVGEKNRYRLLDIGRVLDLIGNTRHVDFQRAYAVEIEHAIKERRFQRETCWTKGIAVGSEAYVRMVADAIRYTHRRLKIEKGPDGSYFVREPAQTYQILGYPHGFCG